MVRECIKYGTKENLTFYSHLASEQRSSWSGKRSQVIMKEITVPTCHNCRTEFNNWNKEDSILLHFVSVCLCCLSVPCLIIVIAFVLTGISDLNSAGISIFVFSVIIVTLTILLGSRKIIHNKKESNPNKYAKIAHRGIKYVKPQNQGRWIRYDDWIKEGIKEIIDTQYGSS